MPRESRNAYEPINRNTNHRNIESRRGRLVKDVCREHSVPEATYYQRKSKYGGIEAADIKRLKDLEKEIRKLKMMVANLSLENHAFKEVIGLKR